MLLSSFFVFVFHFVGTVEKIGKRWNWGTPLSKKFCFSLLTLPTTWASLQSKPLRRVYSWSTSLGMRPMADPLEERVCSILMSQA